MPRAQGNSGVSGLIILAAVCWIATFLTTFGLAVASLATEHWIRWEEEVTKSEHSYGLFLSSSRSDAKPCKLEVVVRRTGEELFRDFDLQSVIALMIVGVCFDVLAVLAGMLYFFAKGKAKTNLWKRSIPTVVSALIASGLMLLSCLIFIVDLHDVSSKPVLAHVDERCTVHLENVKLSPRIDFSFFLAVTAGSLALIKALVFGAVAKFF